MTWHGVELITCLRRKVTQDQGHAKSQNSALAIAEGQGEGDGGRRVLPLILPLLLQININQNHMASQLGNPCGSEWGCIGGIA